MILLFLPILKGQVLRRFGDFQKTSGLLGRSQGVSHFRMCHLVSFAFQ